MKSNYTFFSGQKFSACITKEFTLIGRKMLLSVVQKNTSLDSLIWIGLHFSIHAKSDSLGHFNLSRRQITGSSIILELFYYNIILFQRSIILKLIIMAGPNPNVNSYLGGF